ncbi:coiled-coil domain-containing protein 116 [Tachyglossus aculeatus]|uniref:coiled-coil domain-containing protein 116 n=1 Tax=Tachyglossus aculeatus TaxID=9261 RepID=UPI0018F5906B|nr:coiled-coil domain-containing protein 116 [Tachyglossus aculeatus]
MVISRRRHSGYLADDEAGRFAGLEAVPALAGPHRPRRAPKMEPFSDFLNFLAERDLLDRLQGVVDRAAGQVAGAVAGSQEGPLPLGHRDRRHRRPSSSSWSPPSPSSSGHPRAWAAGTASGTGRPPLPPLREQLSAQAAHLLHKASPFRRLPSLTAQAQASAQAQWPRPRAARAQALMSAQAQTAERAAALLVAKYQYERALARRLGFMSFSITELLLDLFLGFKRLKGSRIRISSHLDWASLLRTLEEADEDRERAAHRSSTDQARGLQQEEAQTLLLQEEREAQALLLKKEEAQALLLKKEEAQALLLQEEEEAQALHLQEEEAQVLLLQKEEVQALLLQKEEAQALLLHKEEAQALLLQKEEAQALLLQEEEAQALLLQKEEAQALLLQEEEAQVLLLQEEKGQAQAPNLLLQEGEALLLQQGEAQAPNLLQQLEKALPLQLQEGEAHPASPQAVASPWPIPAAQPQVHPDGPGPSKEVD